MFFKNIGVSGTQTNTGLVVGLLKNIHASMAKLSVFTSCYINTTEKILHQNIEIFGRYH